MVWILAITLVILGAYVLVILWPELKKMRRIKQALGASQRALTSIIEYNDGLICTHDLNGRLTMINPAFSKLLGYSTEEAVGKKISEFITEPYRNDFAGYLQRIKQNGRDQGIMQVNGRERGRIILEYSNCYIKETEERDYVVGTANDITEGFYARRALEHSKEQYQQLVQNLDQVVYVVNMEASADDGKIKFISDQVKQLTGLPPEEFTGYKVQWTSLVHPDDLLSFEISTKEMFLNKKSLSRIYRIRNLISGEYRWLEDRATPRLDKDGKIAGIFGVAYDITRRKQSEIRLLNATIEGQDKERNRIGRDLHDGLGQILAAVKIHLSMVRKTGCKEEGVDKIKMMIDDAISEYRAISHNLVPPALEKTGLADAIEEFCDKLNYGSPPEVKFSSSGKRIRMERNLRVEIYRIAQELVNNAIKHAGASWILVDLRYDGELVRLDVSDNGKGFDTEKSIKQEKGIGLGSLRTRVSMLNGNIQINSAPGEGTIVDVQIPFRAADEHAE